MDEIWDTCQVCGEKTEGITVCRFCNPVKPLDKDQFKEALRRMDEQLSRLRKNIETCSRIREERLFGLSSIHDKARSPKDNSSVS